MQIAMPFSLKIPRVATITCITTSIDGYWRIGINVGADNTLVHQNDIAHATNRAIRVGGDYNFLHHNIACGSVQIASSAAETKFQHNDYMDPLLDQSTSTAMKKNEEIAVCPFD